MLCVRFQGMISGLQVRLSSCFRIKSDFCTYGIRGTSFIIVDVARQIGIETAHAGQVQNSGVDPDYKGCSLPSLRAGLPFPGTDDLVGHPAAVEKTGLGADALIVDEALHATGIEGKVS